MLVNITPESLENGSRTSVVKTENNFNPKNYLDTKLGAGEDKKVLVIRLLPIDLKTGNPFVKVHMHNVPVPKEIAEKGHKNYMCISKNQDINHEKYGNRCPFCELNREEYNKSLEFPEGSEERKEHQKKSCVYISKEAMIVRCIERGKEDEGVKFWKFNLRNDKTDPYNQMINIYRQRKETAERKGNVANIFDIYKGKDLVVTITEGNAAPTIVDDDEYSPLSDDNAKMEAWINDSKKWQDVFTVKPYEYLKLISENKVPWYDKDNEIWIERPAKTDNKQSDYEAIEKTDKIEDSVNNSITEKAFEPKDDDDLPF